MTEVISIDDVVDSPGTVACDCLIVVPEGDDGAAILREYEQIRDAYAERPIMVVTRSDDIRLIEGILADGASEYVHAPDELPIGLLSAHVRRFAATS